MYVRYVKEMYEELIHAQISQYIPPILFCLSTITFATMKLSPSVLVTLSLLASSGVWVSVKIRTMMWKSLLSLSCTLLRFFSSEKKLCCSKPHSGDEGDNETAGKE